jgi:hypothetical protein
MNTTVLLDIGISSQISYAFDKVMVCDPGAAVFRISTYFPPEERLEEWKKIF